MKEPGDLRETTPVTGGAGPHSLGTGKSMLSSSPARPARPEAAHGPGRGQGNAKLLRRSRQEAVTAHCHLPSNPAPWAGSQAQTLRQGGAGSLAWDLVREALEENGQVTQRWGAGGLVAPLGSEPCPTVKTVLPKG